MTSARDYDATGLRRTDQLAKIVDHCLEAKQIAEANGEKFLAYLLAMAVQETRGAMRADLEADSELGGGVKNAPARPHPTQSPIRQKA